MCILHLTCSTPHQQVTKVATGKKAHGDSTLAMHYKEVSDYHISIPRELRCSVHHNTKVALYNMCRCRYTVLYAWTKT